MYHYIRLPFMMIRSNIRRGQIAKYIEFQKGEKRVNLVRLCENNSAFTSIY